MTDLTPNFTLDSLLRSDTATEKGYSEQFAPPVAVISNLAILAEKLLQPLRDKAGVPVLISSGYRCPRLNTAVGGEGTSQHLTGCAADTNAEGMTTAQWYEFVKGAGIPFDQNLIETNGRGAWWVHLSFDPAKKIQRGECMKGILNADGTGTTCEQDGVIDFSIQPT